MTSLSTYPVLSFSLGKEILDGGFILIDRGFLLVVGGFSLLLGGFSLLAGGFLFSLWGISSFGHFSLLLSNFLFIYFSTIMLTIKFLFNSNSSSDSKPDFGLLLFSYLSNLAKLSSYY